MRRSVTTLVVVAVAVAPGCSDGRATSVAPDGFIPGACRPAGLTSEHSGVALGTTDLDGDGRMEVWLDRSGATARLVALAVVDRCRLRRVERPDGSDAELLYDHNSLCCLPETVGVECADLDGDGREETVETSHDDGTAFGAVPAHPASWSYTAYALEGTTIRPVRHADRLLSRPRLPLRFTSGLDCAAVGR